METSRPAFESGDYNIVDYDSESPRTMLGSWSSEAVAFWWLGYYEGKYPDVNMDVISRKQFKAYEKLALRKEVYDEER